MSKPNVTPEEQNRTFYLPNRNFMYTDPQHAKPRYSTLLNLVGPYSAPLRGGEKYAAFLFRDGNLLDKPWMVMGVQGQDFRSASSGWELKRSALNSAMVQYESDAVTESSPGKGLFDPVVVEQANSSARVIGHVGWVRGDQLLVRVVDQGLGSEPTVLLKRGVEVFVTDEAYQRRPPDGWSAVGISTSQFWRVMTYPNGQVIAIAGQQDREAIQSANWVLFAAAAVAIGAPAGVASVGAPVEIQVALMEVRLATGVVRRLSSLAVSVGGRVAVPTAEEMHRMRGKASPSGTAPSTAGTERARLFYKPTSAGTTGLPAGTGSTTKYGDVTYSTIGNASDVALVKLHEAVHSFLSPKLKFLRTLRADFGIAGYQKSKVLKYLEEALAESYAQLKVNGIKGLPTGIAFPIKEGYVTLTAVAVEGAIATVVYGGVVYGVYYFADKHYSQGDKSE